MINISATRVYTRQKHSFQQFCRFVIDKNHKSTRIVDRIVEGDLRAKTKRRNIPEPLPSGRTYAVKPDGKAGIPCGACREMMMYSDKGAAEAEILCDNETKKTIGLKDLMPEWRGANPTERMNGLSTLKHRYPCKSAF